ncbi:sigma-70 family RNA polymerase sigma factor [Kribbella speibonae]|uniref:Sigma-70 family RNA polymerase sigma factor n=1 Tax=Kribbella speibonae TaxID=1572660 RepID=A0A4R0IFK9_9ACTN|nr:sigma-70 family RNA polymerase sigma factor [Kribbella speibonae]
MAVVVRAQVGDREAVAELVRGWHEAVWGYVRHMLGQADLADDVSQEVWLAVVRGLPRLKEPERFAAWLFTIARRSVVNQLRQRYAEQPHVDVDEEPDPADHVVERIDVRRLLGGVPVMEREVLVLFHLEDLSLEECAEVLGVPVGTVKSRLYRARRLLREEAGS